MNPHFEGTSLNDPARVRPVPDLDMSATLLESDASAATVEGNDAPAGPGVELDARSVGEGHVRAETALARGDQIASW